MAVRTQDQRKTRGPGKKSLEVLGGQAMQPSESIGAGDSNDTEMRQVDRCGTVFEGTLFAERIAVVPWDARIDVVLGRGNRRHN